MSKINMKKVLDKLICLFLTLTIYLIISKASIYITDIMLKGSFKYTWLFVHHTIELLITIIIMLLPVWSNSLSDWGINAENKELTFSIIKKFTIGWIIGTTIYTIVISKLSGTIKFFDFELNCKNTFIYLLFESTIVGISEEMFFRGLIRGVLIKHFDRDIRVICFTITSAGLITALLFAFAHVGIQLFPFEITSFSIMQVTVAFALGIFYEAIFKQTKSLLAPILAHNITDAWLSILYIVIKLIAEGI